MAGPGHSITLQKITLYTPNEKVALALQPTFAGINERQLLPIIEEVFDEFDRPGSEILIERLILDLGTVPLDDFAAVAASRLREALRVELARILAGTAPDAEPGTTILDEDAAEIAILEHYLLSGLWPNWASRPGAFDLDRMMLAIAGRQPAQLGAMLYRIGRDRAVLERLVAHLDEATLERLVEVLEPQHAALIVGTIAESKLAHKAQPVVNMSEDAFADQVWLMTLNYLVAEPGTQFNRREFVKSLLHGMAEQAGAQYGDILSTLRRALQQVAQRRPLRSSLPAILLELAREEGHEFGAAEMPIAGWRDEAEAGDLLEARAPIDTADTGARNYHAQHGWDDVARIFATPLRQPAAEIAAWAEIDAEGMAALLADAEAVFRRYDAAEALVRLASVGIHDDEYAPSTAGMSRIEIVAALLELPASVVRTVMTQAFTAGRRRPMQRFLARVPEREIVRLLRALLPSAMAPGAPFFQSVQAHAAEVVDRLAFYAGLMTAILKGESIALDELAGRTATSSGAAVLTALHPLLQVLPRAFRPREEQLAVILRMTRDVSLERRSIDAEFIARLIRQSLPVPLTTAAVEALRKSLQGLKRASDVATSSRALLRAAIERLAGAIEPATVADTPAEGIAVLTALHTLLQALPRKLRPRDEQLATILRTNKASERLMIDAEYIVRLLRENFAGPLTTAVVQALRASLRDLPAADLAPRGRALLSAAIERLAGDTESDAVAARRAEGVAVLAALHALLQTLPPEFREGDDRVASILPMASDALRQRRPLDAKFVVWLIRESFAVPLTKAMVAALRRTMDDLSHAAELSPRARAVLRAAIEQIGQETERRPAMRQRVAKAEKERTAARDAAAAFLATGRRAYKGKASFTDSKLAAATADLIAHEPARAAAAARLGLARRKALTAWSKRLPESTLARLTSMLEPRRHRSLLDITERLGAMLQEQVVATGKPAFGRRDLWSFVLGFAAAVKGKSWSVRDVLVAFIREEVTPRLGQVALFEDMLQAIAGGAEMASAPAHDAAPDDREVDAVGLPNLLQTNAPADRQQARVILLDSLTSRSRREAIGGALSERQFATALAMLEPHRHKTLLETGQLLFAALAATDKRAAALYGGAQPLHKFLLDFVAGYRGRSWSAETIIREFFRHVAVGHAESLDQEKEGDAFLQSLLAAIGARAATAGMTGMAPTLHRLTPLIMSRAWLRGAETRGPQPVPKAEAPVIPGKPRPAFPLRRPDAAQEKPGRAPIYIDNAGLVLAAPFIPHLFRELGMLEKTEGDGLRLKEPATATRAVHLQQYLVTLRTATPEPLLALNKILAGVPLGAVVGAQIEATERELELCGKVLASMLANWPALATGTSPAGLQNTFMQREGCLTFEGDKWLLKVERKTLDVLVDQVPWSFRTILHSWMPQPLHVEW